MKDELSGLIEKKRFLDICFDEIRRAERYERAFSMLMLSIDYNHFQEKDSQVDNRRLLGTTLIKQFSRVLRDQSRDLDSLARYGGDIFAIALPETSARGAAIAAERIRKATEEHAFSGHDPDVAVRIAVNVGYASYPDHARGVPELLTAGLAALDLAWQDGGNRIVAAQPASEAPKPDETPA